MIDFMVGATPRFELATPVPQIGALNRRYTAPAPLVRKAVYRPWAPRVLSLLSRAARDGPGQSRYVVY